jgi:hypothetical protein
MAFNPTRFSRSGVLRIGAATYASNRRRRSCSRSWKKLFIAFKIIILHSMGKRNGFSTARIDGSSERAATGFSALKTFAAFWVLIPDMFATAWRTGEIRKYQSTGARLSGETNPTSADKDR